MKPKGFTIGFDTVNNHCINDFKTRLGKIVYDEIKEKKIKTGNLQRQLDKLGYNYPIYKVLLNDDCTLVVPFEVYGILMVLVGIDIYLVPNETVNNSNRYIKNRERVKQYVKIEKPGNNTIKQLIKQSDYDK